MLFSGKLQLGNQLRGIWQVVNTAAYSKYSIDMPALTSSVKFSIQLINGGNSWQAQLIYQQTAIEY